jgi:hypothetical protein
VDPDPAFHFDAVPDPSFTLMRILPLAFSRFGPVLQNDPLRLLLPFHFDADPDPAFPFDENPETAFHFDADPVSTLMRIRIQLPKMMRINVDPDPDAQHCRTHPYFYASVSVRLYHCLVCICSS